ncbi:MAG TPA: KpsF/GutQ family sugar-phosphate isomerase [Candidatus Krumholzibacteria bacterium]|nr:KpsF/GutQ family sugar-phosphate isomerase [Candidatus Krumholzibacteria bacterium]
MKPRITPESTPDELIERARRVIDDEIAGLAALRDGLGPELTRAVDAIVACRGRIIVSGVGKSGQIAKKIASTLTSTGTPSFYVHAFEASHGDLGLIKDGDVVLIISKSGMGEELRSFIPALQDLGVTIIAMTASRSSYLAQHSQIVLAFDGSHEAGCLGLAPTTSATVSLVLGHVLASALVERRGFTADDFARTHPGGLLGKRLTLKVREVMRTGAALPVVSEDKTLRDALFETMEKSIGCTGVVNAAGKLTGIVTDGDIKRIITRQEDALDVPVGRVMTRDPRTIDPDVLAADALARMELNLPGPLLMLFIVDAGGTPIGLLHVHDILRAGLKSE